MLLQKKGPVFYFRINHVRNWSWGNWNGSTFFLKNILKKMQAALDASPEVAGGTTRKAGPIRPFPGSNTPSRCEGVEVSFFLFLKLVCHKRLIVVIAPVGLWTENKWKWSRSDSFCHRLVGRFRSDLVFKPKEHATETEHFSVGFSVKPAKIQSFKGLGVHVLVHVATRVSCEP